MGLFNICAVSVAEILRSQRRSQVNRRHLLRISYVKRSPKTHTEPKMPNMSTELLTKGAFSKIKI